MSRESLEYDPEKKEFVRKSAPISLQDPFIQAPDEKKEMPVANPRVPSGAENEENVQHSKHSAPVDPLNKPSSEHRPRRQRQHLVWMLIGTSMVFWVLMILVIFLRGGAEPEPKPERPAKRLPFAN